MPTTGTMTSFFSLAAMSPSNLFMSFIHLLIALQSGEGYLTEKPQDAVRAVGQSVTFTCNSSWTDPVRWWFYCDDCTDKTAEELGTNAVVRLTLSDIKIFGELGAGSPDGYRSMLAIDDVTKWHAGTFRCKDGTGSRGSARLTVTSTPEAVCLTVSPRDQVVVAGDSVVLTASSPSTRLRYYFESLDSKPQQRVELYNGLVLNDCIVDERFSVIGVGDQGHADLVLRSVQPQDAGRFIVKDVRKKAFEVSANLVVFDRFPECKQIWHLSEDDEIQLQCRAKYTGKLTPRVFFLRQDVTDQSLQTTSDGGKILFQRVVKISDLTSGDVADSRHFEISFELSQCGELAGHWSWKHDIPGDIELSTSPKPRPSIWLQPSNMPHVNYVMVALLAAASVIFFVNILTFIILRKRRNSQSVDCKLKATDDEYDRLESKSSSSSINSEDCKA